MQGALLASNLGQSENALASYEKASALRQRLLVAGATPPHSGVALELLSRAGAPTDDVESVRERGEALARRSLSVARVRTARSLIVLRRYDEALALMEPVMTEITTLLNEDPKNLTIQVTFGETAVRLAQAGAGVAERQDGPARQRLLARIEPPVERAIAIYEPLLPRVVGSH